VLGVKTRRMNICSSHKYRNRWAPVERRRSFQCKNNIYQRSCWKDFATNL